MSTSFAVPTHPDEAVTGRHRPAGEPAAPARFARRHAPATPGRYLALEGAEEAYIALDREVMHVGRGLVADVRLDDHLVSRRHAILVRRPAGHRLLDDRSANGTMVNGRRVEQVELSDGDVIVLGRSVLRYVVVT